MIQNTCTFIAAWDFAGLSGIPILGRMVFYLVQEKNGFLVLLLPSSAVGGGCFGVLDQS